MQAGVIDEMMEDMMDSAMDEPELEQETEEEVDKVSLAGLVYCTGLLSWCPWIWMLPWDVYIVSSRPPFLREALALKVICQEVTAL